MSPCSRSSEIHQRFLVAARELSPVLEGAIARNGPLELTLDQQMPFAERLCRVIAGQQLSTKAARAIWNRVIISAAAVPETVPEQSLIDYFAAVDPAVLRACGLSGAKVRAIGGIAQAARAGQLDATELGAMDYGDRTQRLTALWGVGQWTADMMSIFYFGDADIWPDGDVTARKTLERLTRKRRKTTRSAASFAPYRSYLALHMWRHVDAAPD